MGKAQRAHQPIFISPNELFLVSVDR